MKKFVFAVLVIGFFGSNKLSANCFKSDTEPNTGYGNLYELVFPWGGEWTQLVCQESKPEEFGEWFKEKRCFLEVNPH